MAVLLSLAHFGTLRMASVVLVSLSVARISVGSLPRTPGDGPGIFNLNSVRRPLALPVWSTLRGLPGALLAVPMTASLVLRARGTQKDTALCRYAVGQRPRLGGSRTA